MGAFDQSSGNFLDALSNMLAAQRQSNALTSAYDASQLPQQAQQQPAPQQGGIFSNLLASAGLMPAPVPGPAAPVGLAQQTTLGQANLAAGTNGAPADPQPGILGRLLGFGSPQPTPSPVTFGGPQVAALPAGPMPYSGASAGGNAATNPTVRTPQVQSPFPNTGATGSPATSMAPPPGALGYADPSTAAPPVTVSPAPQLAAAPRGLLPDFAAPQGTPSSLSPNAMHALAFYQSKGLSPIAAAALVGGFTNESGGGLNTGALNPGDGTDGSNSVGIAQWNGARAAGLQQYARANGLDPASLDTQLQYSWQELTGPERGSLSALQQAGNPVAATAAALGYERPAGWSAANPAGATTFVPRLQATAALANSPYGAISPVGGGQLGLPSMAQPGGPQPPPTATGFAPQAAAAPPPGSYMGTSAAGQPVPVGPDGAALGYSPPGGAAAAPAARAIAAASPAVAAPLPTGSAPYGTTPLHVGNKIMTRQQTADSEDYDYTDYDAAAAKAGLIPSAAAAPPFVDGQPAQQASASVASASQAAPVGAVANPAASFTPTAPVVPTMTPALTGTIRQLLSNPDTAAFGAELWKAALTKAPTDYQHFEGNDGKIYAFDPRSGTAAVIANGGVKPVVVDKALVDPVTGKAIYDGNTPHTTVVTPDQYAAYGVPAGYRGVVQHKSDGSLTFSAAGTGTADFSTQAQQRQQLMAQQGRDPNDPGVQDYVATGKFPATRAAMNPTEEKAYGVTYDATDALSQGLDQLQQARALSGSINSGALNGFRHSVSDIETAFGGQGDPTVANTTAYDNLIKSAQAQIAKAAVGARVTNYDEQLFQQLAPSSAKSPAERNTILDNMIAAQTAKLNAVQGKLQSMKSGTFFQRGPTPAAQPAAPQAQGYTPAATASDALAQGRAAIQAGADPTAVRARLLQHGVNPAGL